MLPQVSSLLLPNVIEESTSQITVMTSSFDSTSNNGHLSTMATSLQRPLYSVPEDSPYIDSCLNLSTTASSPHRRRPQSKTCPQLQNNLSTNGQFFQRLMKKSRMVMHDIWSVWRLVASPQTSFGEKWMRDKRTPKDLCGKARRVDDLIATIVFVSFIFFSLLLQ